jgi:hypothetical protein
LRGKGTPKLTEVPTLKFLRSRVSFGGERRKGL